MSAQQLAKLVLSAMPFLNSRDIAGALINSFEALPELSEHEKAVIIHEMAVAIKNTGWAFDENEFAVKILNPRGPEA